MTTKKTTSAAIALAVSVAIAFSLGAVGDADVEYDRACANFIAEVEYQKYCEAMASQNLAPDKGSVEAAARASLLGDEAERRRLETQMQAQVKAALNSPQQQAWRSKRDASVKRAEHWMQIMEKFRP